LAGALVIGAYIHPRNHVGLFTRFDLINRVTGRAGLVGELVASAGYLASIPHGDVYGYDEFGDVIVLENITRHKFIVGIGLGSGWDFSKNGGASFIMSARLNTFFEYPFNGYFLPHAAVELGGIYEIDSTGN